ncbi:unnamed protein product, partial [Medioppia subpectinata]
MESGANMYNKYRDVVNKTEAISQGKAIAKQLKCNETEDWIQCLRKADARDILKYENQVMAYPVFGTEFLPISSRQAFIEKKFNTDIDLIAGITRNEGSDFINYVVKDPTHMTLTDFYTGVIAMDLIGYHNVNVQKVAEHYLKVVNTSDSLALRTALGSLIGDLILGCPTYLFAKRFAQTVKESQRVYFYELLYRAEYFAKMLSCTSTMGICHGVDVAFVFGLPFIYPNDYSQEDIAYSNVIMKMWIQFATHGHMDSDWPQLLNNDPIDAPKVHGVVRGRTLHVLDTNVDQFVGIPYAEPPVGKHRFAKSEPITKPFPDIIDATKVKNSCMQNANPMPHIPGTGMSEDCLVLNIWTSDVKAKKPVMFWIHGGGLTYGTIFQEWYNGSALATNDVVVVSVNYRLGPFGFLYGDREDAPGNVGFYDQLLGLKWVRENIHLFGGDRDQITIFGESAGSQSVSAHILSPLSKGLFKRAILESGAHMFNKDRDLVNKTEGISQGKNIAKQLKCNETEDWIQCLRRADAKDILKYATNMFTFPVLGTEFLPISARQAFDEKKFNTDIDLIAGITQNEGIGFVPILVAHPEHMTLTDFHNGVKAIDSLGFHNINIPKVTEHYLKGVNTSDPAALRTALGAVIGDIILICPTYLFAKRFAQTVKESQRVYFYELLYASNNFGKQMACDVKTMGICHGMDVPFVFGLPLIHPNDYTPEDIYYSNVVIKMWTKFATDGHMDSDWPQLLNDDPSGAPKVHGLDPKDLRLVLKDPFHETWVVRGRTLHVLDTNVDQFLGIPYAEPPVGKLRFAKPEPISKPFA